MMSQNGQNYLLQISIGPVQDFISAARRTRDLWFGSAMLSEISKAAALAVHQEGGRLIFPSPQNPEEDLAASDNPDQSMNVANVILAEVDGKSQDEVRAICERAKAAAQERLEGYSQDALKRLEKSGLIDAQRWKDQIKDLLEFYSAWAPVGQDYAGARKTVARLLAARKNVRDFGPNPCGDRVHKCSLDGLRESVFNKKRLEAEDLKRLPKGVRVKENEALDAVGMIKRMAAQAFSSVSRVALDPWIRGRGRDFLERYREEFKEFCEELIQLGSLNRVRAQEGDAFPYEGTALLISRHDAMIKEAKDPNRARDLCAKIERYIENSFAAPDRPQEPYLAFLCADGDRMGATLSGMKSPDEHRKFSGELSKFAKQARDIVKEEHGVCVYAGGDDVMAFLPLDTALNCARRLRNAFHELMGGFGDPKRPPSLSVGLSIAHAMEDLELLLEYGRKAETAAKRGADGKAAEREEDRNGLAVSVSSRGNVPITVRERWDQGTGSQGLAGMPLDQRLLWWAGQFRDGKIPNKFPYELRENAKPYEGWKDEEALRRAIQSDAIYIFNHKDARLSREDKEAVENYIRDRAPDGVKDADGLQTLADEMILAQWIAQGLEQARAPKTEREAGGAA